MQTQLEKAEKLLQSIKITGSHYQIIEKIDKYFKEKEQSLKDYNHKQRGQQ